MIRTRPRVSIATTCGAEFFCLLQARALVGQHIAVISSVDHVEKRLIVKESAQLVRPT